LEAGTDSLPWEQKFWAGSPPAEIFQSVKKHFGLSIAFDEFILIWSFILLLACARPLNVELKKGDHSQTVTQDNKGQRFRILAA
jgi:hypothetical protein